MSESNNLKISFISLIEILLSIISSLIPILTGIVSFLESTIHVTVILTVAALVIGIILFACRKKISRWMLVSFMNKTAPNKKCKITSKKLIYTYKSLDEMSFENEFYVKARHDGLDCFTDRYKWTGSEKITPTPINNNHTIDKLDTSSGYQRYRLNFGKSYNKKDKAVRTGIEFKNMHDKNNTALPFLSTGVYDVTDELILEVRFPINLCVTNIRKLEYLHFTDEEHYNCTTENNAEIDDINNVKKIVYKVKNPVYGGKYAIDWEFCN